MTFSNDWDDLLKEEMEKPYYKDLRRLLIEEYKTQTIYPEAEAIFRAMRLTSFHDTKVLLLGQDPYHGPGQAQGMSFSVPADFPLPPSLVNIYKELKDDLGIIRESGDLTSWAKEGVLLLNTTLTVRRSQPMSHGKIGWEIFTDKVVSLLGRPRQEQKAPHKKSRPPHHRIAPPFASVRLPRLFRLQMFFEDQRVFRSHGRGACGLEVICTYT